MNVDFNKLSTSYEERQKFYQTKEWRDLRDYVLGNNPLCVECKKNGNLVLATECDHKIDIQVSPELCLEPDNVQPLCKSCHSKKTNKKGVKKKGNETILNRIWKIG